ncbi:dehydrogenase E1 component-domain-containing protein [Lentinula aff. lateritia]|uniref:Dehydrogenase E1 component-domain-containing protein n=1 Tax=Lentinula aff. lateritia TaxID=2804960 RepID=A0ACC1U8R8_9AGAR|nr:dehydrogenase E1 component-domain-containing protein [Lentinula aff. lateritia]
MEMVAGALYKAKMIRGVCHLAIIGQEAASADITRNDEVVTLYRCHPLPGVIGELIGRQIGMSRGNSGGMHIFTPFFGGNGIVGAQVPLGAGIAFAQKNTEEATCNFAMYASGCSDILYTKLWYLPCVFVCENNKHGMVLILSFVDGMDVVVGLNSSPLWPLVRTADPSLIQNLNLFRMSDPGFIYRIREEVQRMRSMQDVQGVGTCLISSLSFQQLDKDAIEEAEASPKPNTQLCWD